MTVGERIKAGATHKERDAVSKLDIIERDLNLRFIFESIIYEKEKQIRR